MFKKLKHLNITKLPLFLIPLFLLVSLFLAGCNKQPASSEAPPTTDADKTIQAQKDEIDSLKVHAAALQKIIDASASTTSSSSLLSQAVTVVTHLKNKDMAQLVPLVHPTLGVRFTPYGYVDTANDIVLQGSQLQSQLASNSTLLWGSYDGSGDPIQLNFNDYYDAFVYDEDYINPNLIGNNVIIGTGNTTENIATAYPGDAFVEFHFTGLDPQYSGMDWTSLRLVFTNVGGNWLLVGIVHAQWTI